MARYRQRSRDAASHQHKKDTAPASATASDTGKPARKSRYLLLITLAVILIVELMIVTGLWDRYTIATYRARARHAVVKKNYDRAIYYYNKLLKIAPLSATVNREIAMAYLGKDDYANAINHLQTALDTDDTLTGLNGMIGMAKIQLGRPTEAYPYFERELKLDPLNADANFYLGRRDLEQNRLRDATAKFQIIANNWKYKDQVKALNQQIEQRILQEVKAKQEQNAPAGEAPPGTSPDATPAPTP